MPAVVGDLSVHATYHVPLVGLPVSQSRFVELLIIFIKDTMVPSSSPIRVLIADCNTDAAELLGILLRSHGFEVHVECGRAAALEAARRFVPHAVLVDLGPSNLETLELIAAVRLDSNLGDPYIVTLAYLPELSELRESEVRIDVRLTKPMAYRSVVNILKTRFDMRGR